MNNNGILEGGVLYSGRVAAIKGSAFVNSRDSDSERSQRFFLEIRQTDVVQKEFSV
jgi:hypothetical protein